MYLRLAIAISHRTYSVASQEAFVKVFITLIRLFQLHYPSLSVPGNLVDILWGRRLPCENPNSALYVCLHIKLFQGNLREMLLFSQIY